MFVRFTVNGQEVLEVTRKGILLSCFPQIPSMRLIIYYYVCWFCTESITTGQTGICLVCLRGTCRKTIQSQTKPVDLSMRSRGFSAGGGACARGAEADEFAQAEAGFGA